ncbi:SagB family peptide dehydrogenase [Microbispora sp. H11081]|uniref:SagB/ThcOx family dehydrogenase n=1 Tax=Microbispora sp. H11081 TaxID=2729107 RepID=UPI0014760CCA|nr:SagB family peptide dehydrogenase [Microbispora sp. H11081]
MHTVQLRLRRDAGLSEPEGTPGALTLATPFGPAALRGLPPGAVAALRALAGGGVSEEELAGIVTSHDGEGGLLRWHLLLRKLSAGALLERAVTSSGGDPVAVLRPYGGGPLRAAAPLAADARVRLSRFAVAAPEDGRLVVRAPRSPLGVELAPAAAPLLGLLADWTTPAALVCPGLPDATTAAVLGLFAGAGLLVRPTQEGKDPERGAAPLAQWSPADLWLHTRTREPRASARYGGSYPMRGVQDPLPVTPPAFPGPRITLEPPDLDAIAKTEAGLTDVLEARRSIREHDAAAPITLDRLGELLYRTMRQRGTFTGEDGQELADRPYPSGGAVHELEVYPLVVSCEGLEAGLWHYAAGAHALERVADPGPATRTLLDRARSAAMMTDDPQVLLLVTARFGRVMWKYETIAYSLILKHVGVLYQTFYLVATAMGLAVCGLGGGDAAEFAAASGLDPHAEGSVGELVLGSRPGGAAGTPPQWRTGVPM